MGRLGLLLSMFVGMLLFVTSVYVVYSQREAKREEERQENLRVSGLAEKLKKRKEADEIAKAAASGPIAVVPEKVYEFGQISGQEQLKYAFKIRNAGQAPLTLKLDKPSCTCIVAKAVKDVLQPGEESELELAFNPQGKINQVQQWADVYTNDPTQPRIRFELIGQTIKKVWADSASFLFRDMQPLEERSLTVKIFSIYPEGFDLGSFEISPKEITVKTEPLSVEEIQMEKAKSGIALIATASSKMPTCDGNIHCFVRPKLDGDQEDVRLSFDVSANRLGLLGMYGTPLDEYGRMEFKQIPHGTAKKYTYILKARGEDKLLKVKRLYVEPDFIKVSITPDANAANNGLHTMVVEFPADAPEVSHLGKEPGKLEIDFEPDYYNQKKFYFELFFAIAKVEKVD
jgi:hypothetical protein